jgi:CRISPR-associated protein Csd1
VLLTDLEALHADLLRDGRLTPPGFEARAVQLIIELDVDGRCVGAIDLGREATRRVVPTLARSRKAVATIVVDNGQYVLGVAQRADEREQQRAAQARAAYLERLDQACQDLPDVPELGAIRQFVDDAGAARSALEARGIRFAPLADGTYPHAGALVAFRVAGTDPVDHPALQGWWASAVASEVGTGASGVCQVAGTVQPLARLMPAVKGIGGTQPKLISSNFDSAERYGATQSSGSQLGVTTASRTHQALNWLLGEPGHHRRIGGLTFAWWVSDDLDYDPMSMMFDSSDDVEQLLASAWRGKPAASSDAVFRLLGLSVSEARAVVRVDHTTALDDLRRRVERWLALVAVPGRAGAIWHVSIERLAKCAMGPGSGSARQAQRDRIVSDLATSLITGKAPPERVRNAAVIRCRAERAVPSERAALLQLCRQFEEENMTNHRSEIGELCGRLLAQLERAQWAALGETNRTVTDRYYAKASVNPEQAFPQLLRGAQAHLSKARRRKPGAHVLVARRLGELADQIQTAGGIPRVLSMGGQADFALGYWQERQSFFAHVVDSSHPEDPSHREGETT